MEIWKYAIVHGEFVSELPFGAEIIAVGETNGEPCFWAKVDPTKVKTIRKFRGIFTGEAFNGEVWSKYKGSCTAGGLVYHLFTIV